MKCKHWDHVIGGVCLECTEEKQQQLRARIKELEEQSRDEKAANDICVQVADRLRTRVEELELKNRRLIFELNLIKADVNGFTTDCSTPTFECVRNAIERLEKLEADLIAEKQRNADYQHKCIVATGVDVPVCGMTVIEAIEAAIRPAEGLPTWRELCEIALNVEYCASQKHSPPYACALILFGLEELKAKQLCIALGRDPVSGEKVEE